MTLTRLFTATALCIILLAGQALSQSISSPPLSSPKTAQTKASTAATAVRNTSYEVGGERVPTP